MLVQINTDNRLEGTTATAAAIEDRVRERLARFADRLTRVEVHIRDVDGDRNGGQGIEATLEARPAGGQPIAVTDQARCDNSARGASTGAPRHYAQIKNASSSAFGQNSNQLELPDYASQLST
jgi:predicted component of type VI protein secretion system